MKSHLLLLSVFFKNFDFGLNSFLVNLGSLVLQALLEHWPQSHAKGSICTNFIFEIVVIISNIDNDIAISKIYFS